MSAFSLFHSAPSQPLARIAPRAVAQSPPSHIVAQQAESLHSMQMNSLDALAAQGVVRADERKAAREEDDELFAVTLSPRSPDMAKSPFSLVTAEAVPWR